MISWGRRCAYSALPQWLPCCPASSPKHSGCIPATAHYFEYQGNPALLITSGEHYGAVLNRDFDYRKYLDTVARDGLNLTRVFAGTYREQAGASFGIARNTLAPGSDAYVAPWARSAIPGYAAGGNKFDLDRWDSAYFQRLKVFLTYASKLGIAVELTLFSSHYEERHWNLSPLNPANNVNATSGIQWKKLHALDNGNILDRQEKVVRMIVRELNAFDNVYFEIQNEPWSDHPRTVSILNPYLTGPGRDKWPNSVDVADDASLAWQAQVVTWIERKKPPYRSGT